MSEKLQVTAEQHLALKDFFSFFKENPLKRFAIHGEFFSAEYKSIKDFTLDQMAQALYVGYEIEQPKFEIGDWVTRIKDSANEKPQFREGKTFKVKYSHGNTVVADSSYHNKTSLRHATKEEIMWAELGREVGKFLHGDIITNHNGESFKVSEHLIKGKTSNEMYENGEIKGFYPANSFIKLP